MDPQRQLKELRGNAHWNKIELESEPWRRGSRPEPSANRLQLVIGGIVSAAVIAAVVAAVVWLHPSAGSSVAASPDTSRSQSPSTASPTPSGSPARDADANNRVATAVLPPTATQQSTAPSGAATAAGPAEACPMTSDAVGYWSIPDMSVDETVSWLGSHSASGLKRILAVKPGPAATGAQEVGYVVQAASREAQDGLVLTVTPAGTGATVRVDAVTIPAGAGCVDPTVSSGS